MDQHGHPLSWPIALLAVFVGFAPLLRGQIRLHHGVTQKSSRQAATALTAQGQRGRPVRAELRQSGHFRRRLDISHFFSRALSSAERLPRHRGQKVTPK
jgi:hypothetical protein